MSDFDFVFSASVLSVNLALGLLANDPVSTDVPLTVILTVVLTCCKLAKMFYWISEARGIDSHLGEGGCS